MATISYYGLPSVQSDLTPVLGGNLNSNGKSITNALNVNAAESNNNTIGTAGKTTFLGNGASLVGLQASGAILTALNAITGSGLIALKQDGTFSTRGIDVSLPLTITNPSGVGGNPAISMNAASVVNNGYMVALDYYKLSGINAGVWVLGEDGTSDFYGAGASDTARGANLLLAVGFLTENQEVIVGVGNYDVGSNQLLLPKGGKIRGQGPNKTYIKSSLNSSSLASLALASGAVASDFTFQEHNGVNVIGGASADNTFTGAVVENVYITGSHPASGTLNGISLNTPGSGELTLRRVYINSDAEGVVVGGSNYNRLRSVDTEVNVYGSSASRNHGYRIKNNGSGCGIEIFGGYTTVSGNIGAGNIAICNEGSGTTAIKVFNHSVLASGTGNTFDILGQVYVAHTANKTGINVTNTSGTLTYLDGILSVPRGGTGLSSLTANRIPYATATNTLGTNANLTFNATTLNVGNTELNNLGLYNPGTIDVGSDLTLGLYGVQAITMGDGNSLYWHMGPSGAVSLGKGSYAAPKAILELVSTGSGFIMPKMTTAQKNAITGPPEGLEVYDTTLHARNVWNGNAWIGERKAVTIAAIAPTTNVSTGDGKFYFVVPTPLSGLNIVRVHSAVVTAGTTGTTDVQIARMRGGSPVDVLSTKLTIDSTETGSDTAATPPVINASNDDLQPNDILRIDVDNISTTPPQGLIVTIEVE